MSEILILTGYGKYHRVPDVLSGGGARGGRV